MLKPKILYFIFFFNCDSFIAAVLLIARRSELTLFACSKNARKDDDHV